MRIDNFVIYKRKNLFANEKLTWDFLYLDWNKLQIWKKFISCLILSRGEKKNEDFDHQNSCSKATLCFFEPFLKMQCQFFSKLFINGILYGTPLRYAHFWKTTKNQSSLLVEIRCSSTFSWRICKSCTPTVWVLCFSSAFGFENFKV